MATRSVTFTLLKADGSAWAGGVVTFELLPGGYETGGTQYPAATVKATAGTDGTGSISLWRSEAGVTTIKFRCTLPNGEQFMFSVPDAGTAIDLSTLRAA